MKHDTAIKILDEYDVVVDDLTNLYKYETQSDMTDDQEKRGLLRLRILDAMEGKTHSEKMPIRCWVFGHDLAFNVTWDVERPKYMAFGCKRCKKSFGDNIPIPQFVPIWRRILGR